jgi:Flp pilus assembly protein TadD
MKTMTLTAMVAASLCTGAVGWGAEPRSLPIDEQRIQAEMDGLQDASAPMTSEVAEKAARLVSEGVRLHNEGKLDKAIAKYREAIAVAPLFANAYYELAYSLTDLGQHAEALEAITRALALDPKEEQFYVLKGNALDNLGFTEQAKATYRRLLEVLPESYMGLINLGITHLRLGENAEAEAVLVRARDLAPDKPSAYFHLAAAARARGFNYDEEGLLKRFLEVGPQDPRAETVRGRLEEMKHVNVTVGPDAPFAHIELATAMKRALWRTEEHRQRHPKARGYQPTYEEESAILRLLLSMWRQQKEKDPSAQHGQYDLILAVDEAGFLDEYVYYTQQRVLGEEANKWLLEHADRMQAFVAWAREKGSMRDQADAQAAPQEESPRLRPARLLKVMTESEVHYAIGAEVENASARFLDQEAKRFRKRLDLTGENQIACAADGDYSRRAKAQELGLALVILRCHPDDNDARRRALGQLAGMGATAREIDLALEGGVFEEDGEVKICYSAGAPGMSYWLAKAAWPREGALSEAEGLGTAGSPSVEEEMYALAVAAEGYLNALEGEGDKSGKRRPAWDELVRVIEAGHLRGFVLYEILGRRYGMSLARLSEPDAAALDRYLRAFVQQQPGQ